jgi:hypothetical protein
VTADATTYDRIGQLIGRAVSATRKSAALDRRPVSSLRASLHGAGLLALPTANPNVARWCCRHRQGRWSRCVLDGLVTGLAAVARGVVVAGPTGDVSIAGLRAAPPVRPVATVDGTETAAGRVASILALVHVLTTPGGSFGASGADSPVPLG